MNQEGDRLLRKAESATEILLLEYERLKSEQAQRIGTRDNLIYANLLSLAGVVAATLQANSLDLLLLLPPVSLVLGWTYVVNDEKVSAIGRYVRTVIGPRLEAMVGERVLEWELAHRSDDRRRSRKLTQLVVDLTTFVLPGLIALVVFWRDAAPSPWLLTVSVVELAAVAVLAAQIIWYADLDRAG